MNEQDFNTWLDQKSGELPRGIEPQRDLWSQIEARLDTDSQRFPDTVMRGSSRLWPFAAGMAATALIALVTVQLTQTAPQQPLAQSTNYEVLVQEVWRPEITRARNQMNVDFDSSLETLSPETRAVVEKNLAQIHESLAAIHAALVEDPTNQSLHRLLAGTYQQELNLLSSIGARGKVESEL